MNHEYERYRETIRRLSYERDALMRDRDSARAAVLAAERAEMQSSAENEDSKKRRIETKYTVVVSEMDTARIRLALVEALCKAEHFERSSRAAYHTGAEQMWQEEAAEIRNLIERFLT